MPDPTRHSWDESDFCRYCGHRLDENVFTPCPAVVTIDDIHGPILFNITAGTDDEIDPTPYDLEVGEDG